MALFGPPDVRTLEGKKDVKGLTKALGYKKDWQIRRDAAMALGRICHIRKGGWVWYEKGPPPCVGPLTTMLGDENPEISFAAAVALGRFGEHGVIMRLEALHKDESLSAEKREALEDASQVLNYSTKTELAQLWSLHGAPWLKR